MEPPAANESTSRQLSTHMQGEGQWLEVNDANLVHGGMAQFA
jgi:hypothetical protein